jgi:hypothetical protein
MLRRPSQRRIATRHDKTTSSFLGFILSECGRIWIRFVHRVQSRASRFPGRLAFGRVQGEIGKGATAQLPDQAIGRNEDSYGRSFGLQLVQFGRGQGHFYVAITVARLVEVARHASRIIPSRHAARIGYDLAEFERIR